MDFPENWQEKQDKLTRNFTFKNFVEAIAFVNKVADLAEKNNHHPDILIHGYKQVTITLVTHDAGNKITDKDISLARGIDKIFT